MCLKELLPNLTLLDPARTRRDRETLKMTQIDRSYFDKTDLIIIFDD